MPSADAQQGLVSLTRHETASGLLIMRRLCAPEVRVESCESCVTVELGDTGTQVDVITAHASAATAQHGLLSPTFAFFRSAARTHVFLRTMVGLTPAVQWLAGDGGGDQMVANAVMQHWRFRQLAFHTLPEATLCALPAGRCAGGGQGAALLHVGDMPPQEDMALLHDAHAWYLQRRCSTQQGGVNAVCDTPQSLCEPAQ